MRVLLDTNILIHREAATVTREEIGPLFAWLDRLGAEKCVHPASAAEIGRHADEKIRKTFQVKLSSYHLIQAVAPLLPTVKALSDQEDRTDNDRTDTLLLNEVASERVDVLISEDRGIARKARTLGLSQRVFTIEAFLEKATAEHPELVDYSVLAVRKQLFGLTDLSDTFFDSFRADYPGFEVWFGRKADESAYVCYDGTSLVAFLYLKVEGAREAYGDISPQMKPANRLKIGTFKVSLNGFKLGERFLKIIFDNALRQRVDEVYVTIFPRSVEQQRLVALLIEYGFVRFGTKAGPGGEEDVYVRATSPAFDPENPKLTFPFVSRTARWFIVPIYPDYHTSLLPDSILRTESPADFVEQEPHRNAIRKVYVCRSLRRDLSPGDTIVFYRTGGYYKSVITTLGIVEAVHLSFSGEAEFVACCRRRSVFSDDELRRHWRYSSNRPFAVDFLYAYSFPKRPNLKALIDAGVVRSVDEAPRGFELLSNASVDSVLRLTSTDPRLVVGSA